MIILAVTVVHNHGHVNGCTTNCSAVQCKRQNLLLTHASYAALLCAAMMCAAISLEAQHRRNEPLSHSSFTAVSRQCSTPSCSILLTTVTPQARDTFSHDAQHGTRNLSASSQEDRNCRGCHWSGSKCQTTICLGEHWFRSCRSPPGCSRPMWHRWESNCSHIGCSTATMRVADVPAFQLKLSSTGGVPWLPQKRMR